MINIFPSAEQQQVVDSAMDVLARECSPDRLRAGRAPAREQQLMRLFGELGWFRFSLPEEHGGNGFDLTEETLVFRQMGRSLASPALVAQGVTAALLAGSQHKGLIGPILNGQLKVGLACPGQAGTLFCIDANEAALFLLVSPSGLMVLPAEDLRDVQPLRSLDDCLELRRATGSRAAPLARQGVGALHQRALLLWSAQLLGVAESARDMAAEYAKVRMQFGKPIGSFQAIAHQCANMAMRCEAAMCQMLFAAISLRDQAGDAAFQVAALATVAGEAAFQNATTNIQVHGGIGFTADCHAQRLLKRAVLLRQLVGRPGAHAVVLLTQSESSTSTC